MIVIVLDLEWNPDLPNTEPQCIMMFQIAHIHRKSNVYLNLLKATGNVMHQLV